MTPGNLPVAVFVLVASLALPVAVRPVLVRLGVVDIPNDRSSHLHPAVRGVGLAPMIALAAGGILLLLQVGLNGSWPTLYACLGTATLAASIGLAEDIRGIPTKRRAALQLLVGMLGAIVIVLVTDAPYIWIPLGALAIAIYINAANFMDGIDGISGLHGVVVGSTFATIGVLVESDWLVAGGAMLAAAFLGFLPWNVLRGRMFLGDVGSYLLGSLVAALALAAFVDGVNPVALVAPVALYLTDTGTTVLRRVRHGEPWLEAHRTHVYQRLVDQGFSHLQVATIVAAGSLSAGLAGLLSIPGELPLTVLAVALIALIAVAYSQAASPRAASLT